jgi:hypothetical protein
MLEKQNKRNLILLFCPVEYYFNEPGRGRNEEKIRNQERQSSK